MQQIEVRRLQREDCVDYFKSICTLVCDHFGTAKDQEAVNTAVYASFENPNTDILAAFADGFLVAAAVGNQTQTLTGKSYLVDSVVCHPEYRGQGIGRAVMRGLFARAQELEIGQVFLTCSRPEAQTFYQALGFQEKDTTVYTRSS